MRKPSVFADPGLWGVLTLATLAAWPFLTRASLVTFTDAEMHAFRTIEILQAWRAGVPYLRWAPDLFYGYGYPVFNYYAPLTYYLGAAYGWFTDAAAGVKFVLVASAYLGALGMYCFVRDEWGAPAGLVSAAAFGFAPYLVYIDPLARGDSPETFALALAPWMFWAFRRIQRAPSPGRTALAAVILAGLILSHNLMALIFFALLLGWLGWGWLFDRTQRSWTQIAWLAAAVGLGLMLSAFMWLPAVAERDAVQFRNVAGGTYFDFRRYFISFQELFAPNLIFDLGATQMRFNHNVGLAQWALASIGAVVVARSAIRRAFGGFFLLAALVLIFFMLPWSLPVWEAIPPMAYLQFPTRLLGPTAVMLAVLAGAVVAGVEQGRNRTLGLTLAAVAVCVGTAMPLLYPPVWPWFGPATPQAILRTELDGRGIGTTSANDFLPVQVVAVPGPQQAVVDSYWAGQPDKVNHVTLPAGSSLETLAAGPEAYRWRIESPTDFTFRVFMFYFAGWTAFVDDQPVPIDPSEPEGWMTLRVPAGRHLIRLELHNTPPRWWGSGLTVLAAVVVLGLGVWKATGSPRAAPSSSLDLRIGAALGGLVLLAFLIRVADDHWGWWRVQSTGNTVQVAQTQRFAALEGHVALLAFDLPSASARPGAKVPVTLYWKAQAKVSVNLRVFIHFIGPDGQLWGQSDKWNPADFPTSRFPLDLYVRDEHLAVLQPDAPPGTYTVIAGLWDGTTGARMHVLGGDGQPTAADAVTLTTEFVVR